SLGGGTYDSALTPTVGGSACPANQLDARNAAAIVAGLVDSIEYLETAAQSAQIDLAVRWPQNSVRRQALELVGERDGPDEANALGKNDPIKAVRSWAESLRERAEADMRRQPPVEGDERGSLRHGQPRDQPTLF
ncbi:MAG TPA: hypothetical protein VE569_06100, partial [Acidimicrobiia bacterium]|nr:hypothetical protein [Acidimicrobiia bacterium]